MDDQKLGDIFRQVAGKGARPESRGEREQRVAICKALTWLLQNYDPYEVMSMMVVGLAFACDEYGVDRSKVIESLREARQNHALIVNAGGRS